MHQQQSPKISTHAHPRRTASKHPTSNHSDLVRRSFSTRTAASFPVESVAFLGEVGVDVGFRNVEDCLVFCGRYWVQRVGMRWDGCIAPGRVMEW